MRRLSILLLFIHLINAATQIARATKARHFQWSVEYVMWSPDCSDERAVIGINGQFPGPTIRAQVGDVIDLELTNKLNTEGVVIHWHGIRQIGTPWADGTALISQCPINPGEKFTYRFTVDKAGTYFYHGHYGMQRSAGLYGTLIVEEEEKKEPFQYDGEFDMLLTDFWHQSTVQQETGLDSVPMRWIGEPQSLLINGRGQYNCSLSPGFTALSSTTPCNFTGKEQCSPQLLTVLPNKTYRLRLASSTSLAALNIGIQNHQMTVVEADGNYIQPFTTSDLDIYSGETFSVLIKTDQNPNQNYWISIGVRGREPKTAPALTILHYQTATSSPLIPTPTPPVTPLWSNFTHSKEFANKLSSLPGSPTPPTTTTTPPRRVTLLNTQNKINGQIRWSINNISLSLPPTPYLGSIKLRLKHAFDTKPPPQTYTPSTYNIYNPPINPNTTRGSHVYMFGLNTTVDVVLQNANGLNINASEIHPWHLHGHDFWVLGYGEGKFTAQDMTSLNYVNPPLKNTAVIFPYGWTVLRFVADNPGVWAFHCHIEPHLHMGMGVVFAEGVHMVRDIPTEALGCGLSGKILPKKHKVIP